VAGGSVTGGSVVPAASVVGAEVSSVDSPPPHAVMANVQIAAIAATRTLLLVEIMRRI
jgi:hypothetical protein